MSNSSLTLLVTVIVGLGVISAGVWRIASAVFKLVAKVDLLAYRIEQIEKKQLAVVPVRSRPRRGAPG